MTKTPEQMAEEYAEDKSKAYYIGQDGERKWYPSLRGKYTKEDFLTGYQAAMNSPEKQDSCEHILDMKQMVDVNPSGGWISVKDRLPEDASDVLIVWLDGVSIACYDDGWNKVGTMLRSVTHWMPLPKPPEVAHD